MLVLVCCADDTIPTMTLREFQIAIPYQLSYYKGFDLKEDTREHKTHFVLQEFFALADTFKRPYRWDNFYVQIVTISLNDTSINAILAVVSDA